MLVSIVRRHIYGGRFGLRLGRRRPRADRKLMLDAVDRDELLGPGQRLPGGETRSRLLMLLYIAREMRDEQVRSRLPVISFE